MHSDLSSLSWKGRLSCFLHSFVRHITPLVGLESNVATQSWQLCIWTLGLEPNCQSCPHSCHHHCLGLFELTELQCLEKLQTKLGPEDNL